MFPLNIDSFAGISSHQYDFTDNEFLSFLADLDSVEYVITITIIVILISVNLNIFEQFYIFAALLDIATTSGGMVQQEGFRLTQKGIMVANTRREYIQENLDSLYNEIERLTQELEQLKQETSQQIND